MVEMKREAFVWNKEHVYFLVSSREDELPVKHDNESINYLCIHFEHVSYIVSIHVYFPVSSEFIFHNDH